MKSLWSIYNPPLTGILSKINNCGLLTYEVVIEQKSKLLQFRYGGLSTFVYKFFLIHSKV